jgi:hypothetical protein
MEGTGTSPVTRQTISIDVIHIAIADKVRSDSQMFAKPIPVEALGTLFPDMQPEEIVDHLAALVKVEKYGDIKVMTWGSGAAYLYSDTFIAPEDASKKILMEETQAKIAEQVRHVSKESAQLIAAPALSEYAPDVQPSELAEFVAAMASDPRYKDIHQVVGPAGAAYLYSATYLTDNYANLLARVESKDPCTAVAETVREESRIFPRPTKVELFYSPVFQIAPGQMETVVENTLRRPEFSDIKKIVATTGAIYLFSDKYMEPGQAETLVRWEEVDKYRNQ